MLKIEGIPEKVAEYLVSELKNLSTFYHLLKTHKIPQDVDNPSDWLESNGFPLRGIISSRGSPTERISGFVDIFLQPCMKQLLSFLQDTKHLLQIIEEINQKSLEEEVSLDGVALVTLDADSMYNNIPEELAMVASKDFLERGREGDKKKSSSEDTVYLGSLGSLFEK